VIFYDQPNQTNRNKKTKKFNVNVHTKDIKSKEENETELTYMPKYCIIPIRGNITVSTVNAAKQHKQQSD